MDFASEWYICAMDGARATTPVRRFESSLKELAMDCGVDILKFWRNEEPD